MPIGSSSYVSYRTIGPLVLEVEGKVKKKRTKEEETGKIDLQC